MGKIDAKMEGRTEGLELALRIVREGGAEDQRADPGYRSCYEHPGAKR